MRVFPRKQGEHIKIIMYYYFVLVVVCLVVLEQYVLKMASLLRYETCYDVKSCIYFEKHICMNIFLSRCNARAFLLVLLKYVPLY